MIFEWDSRKARSNLAKHGVSFEEAAQVFMDPLALTFQDPDHSHLELREITIGHTEEGRLVFVAHCERGHRMRVISARPATDRERKQYEEGTCESDA